MNPTPVANTQPDLLIRAVHRTLNIRLVAAITTQLCRTASARHKLSAAAACALGRGLSASLLLATLTKGGERVTIQIEGNGPLKGLTVDAYDDGAVRGYVLEPQAWADRSMVKRQRLGPLLGHDGVVNVLRDVGLKERFQGQVNLIVSEIDEDIEAYLRQSEQIPSALGCELIMDEAGAILQSGCVLLQTMPDSTPEAHHQVREAQHILRSGELFDLLKQGPQTPLALAQLVMGPHASGIEVLDTRPLAFRCRCDIRRIEAMLGSLTLNDLDEMIDEGEANITCNFCSEVYRLSKETLLTARAQLKPREQN